MYEEEKKSPIMATKLDLFATHGSAESSSLLGTTGGAHIYNLKAHADLDNGNVVALGKYSKTDIDVWESKAPGETDFVFLVLQSEDAYEDYTPAFLDVKRFYNAKGDVVRCYALHPLDRFAIDKEALGTQAEQAAIGKYLVVEANQVGLKVDESASESGFTAYIYDVATNGKFRAIVVKNGEFTITPLD